MIHIDTEALKTMVSTLRTVNDRIEEACALLLQITEHEEWGCRERNIINDFTLTNREEIQKIQECNSSFLSAASQVADEFVATESGISGMFEGVEVKIAQVLAGTTIRNVSSNMPDEFQGVAGLSEKAANAWTSTADWHTHRPNGIIDLGTLEL